MLVSNLPDRDNLDGILNENLYYALILIINKLVQPNNLPYLKEKIIEIGLEFEEIIDLEMLILNRIDWKIFLRTPIELITQLISDVVNLNFYNQSYLNDVYKSTMELIDFCFSETYIYINFDQFAFSISCLMICLENYSEETLANELKSFLITNIKFIIIIQSIHNCKIYLEKKLFNRNNNELKKLTQDFNEAKLETYENKNTDNSLDNSKFSTLEYEKNKDFIYVQEDNGKNYSTIDFDNDVNQKK